METVAQPHIIPAMQDVSSAVQIQGQKGAAQKQTATKTAMQTQAVIQI